MSAGTCVVCGRATRSVRGPAPVACELHLTAYRSEQRRLRRVRGKVAAALAAVSAELEGYPEDHPVRIIAGKRLELVGADLAEAGAVPGGPSWAARARGVRR